MTIIATAVYSEVTAAVITLSGEIGIAAIDSNAPYDSQSGIRVNDDGTIDKLTTSGTTKTYTQIDSGTDWIIPNGDASSDYEFKLDVTFGSPNYLSDSTATWIAMGSGSQSASWLIWRYQRTTQGNTTWSWTLRVRENGGAEIDNGAYAGNSEAGVL